jgi:hypothetical protein
VAGRQVTANVMARVAETRDARAVRLEGGPYDAEMCLLWDQG